ncbi:MAG: nuclear transport factor 2 family protein [Erythrobacter sp.]|nr:MAG: nuclear transport factor 2 family protein [Erythrobacter sp.]
MPWQRKSPVKVALAFVEACNTRNAEALAAILSPDVVFQDSRGGRIEGREAMLEALARVDSVAPDLRVEIDRSSTRGDSALLTGRSITSNPVLACDTQWRAVVIDGKLVEWQAYGRPSANSLVFMLRAVEPDDGSPKSS